MREVALDTETTGFDPDTGDRMVEIACVEMINHQSTGVHFHKYINPQRDVPEEARRVHGLTIEFLQDKPLFSEIADEFIEFVGDSPMVIHNAAFDMKFINFELQNCGRPTLPYAQAIDTLQIARERFPGARATLDALCQRFGIDNSHRELHGALLDTELLAEVYLELCGGREPGLTLDAAQSGNGNSKHVKKVLNRQFREPRSHTPTAEETAAFQDFIAKLKEPIWLKGQENG